MHFMCDVLENRFGGKQISFQTKAKDRVIGNHFFVKNL